MKKIIITAAVLCMLAGLTGCGTNTETTAFKEDIDSFCTAVSELDASINNINAEDENASVILLDYLDELDEKFQGLAELEFPEDYAYLEPLADEAGSYMSTAVAAYHEAYEGETYDADKAEYAQENAERAFKYVQYMLAYLRGEDPTADAADTAETEETTAQ